MILFIATKQVAKGGQADFHRCLVPPILDCVEGEMDPQFYEWVS